MHNNYYERESLCQWRRKIFFYGDAHTFPAIVVNGFHYNLLFHYSEVGRIWEPGGLDITGDHETARFKVHCI